MNLAESVGIVTGVSGGIGEAIAYELSRRGTSLALTYFTREKVCEEIVTRINSYNERAFATKLDLKSGEDIRRIVDETLSKYGKINFLVNNAGVNYPLKFEDYTQKDWYEIMDSNGRGTYELVWSVIPYMKKIGGGRIVNISSIATFTGNSSNPIYGMSKAAIDSLTITLGKYLAQYNIQVNSIAPGETDTLLWNKFVQSEEDKKRVAENIPMKRFGKPEEIAKMVRLLLEDAPDFLTGKTIPVTGGK